MIAVILKNGVPSEKRAYSGDVSKVEQSLKDAGLEYQIYEDERSVEVQAVVIEDSTTKSKKDWATAKAQGTDAAIRFMAKAMGLE